MEPKPVAVPDATPPSRAVLLAWASVPSVTPSWALSSSSGLVPACPSGSSPGSHLTTSARDRRLCPRTPEAGPCRLGLVSEARPAPACSRSCTNASKQLNPENEVTSAGGGGVSRAPPTPDKMNARCGPALRNFQFHSTRVLASGRRPPPFRSAQSCDSAPFHFHFDSSV